MSWDNLLQENISPLLLLPAELRQSIYRFALDFARALRLQDEKTKQSVTPQDLNIRHNAAKARSTCIYRKQIWSSDRSCISLLLTCHATYYNAIEILYTSNTFHFPALLGGITASLAPIPSLDIVPSTFHTQSPICGAAAWVLTLIQQLLRVSNSLSALVRI